MGLPGFTAESSLGPAIGHYGGAIMSGTSGARVVPTQLFVAPGLLRWAREIYCCQFIGGQTQCIKRTLLPWENCRCGEGFFGPVIDCSAVGSFEPRFEIARF